ncbi:MAG: bifunctional DNA primase/polymerase [Streptosporangiaceae bacterium]
MFPCKPGGKEPDTAHGFHEATTDPDVIRAWWRTRPDRNVAIATGTPGPDVLDVDTGPAGSGWAAFGQLKRAGLLTGASALVRTRSGGLHVYFVGTDQQCGRLPRHFLDFKAAGGYVLAAPSFVAADVKPAGTYALVDQRDATGRLDWQAVRRLLDPPRPVSLPRPGRRAGSAALAEWVAALTEGNRNAGPFWAACRMAEAGHAADFDQLVAAAVRAGLDETEARRTVASADRRVTR